MNLKNFLLAGIAGGITDFLLGWVFYGMLFHEFFGGQEPNLTYIFAGCMSFGLLLGYIYVGWTNITSWLQGLKAGAGIGIILGIMQNFFRISMDKGAIDQMFVVDVVICALIGLGVGAVVGSVNGAFSKSKA